MPIAITAVTGQDLQQKNIEDLQDIQYSIPSLVTFRTGRRPQYRSTLVLRGLAVVTYFNEVPTSSLGGSGAVVGGAVAGTGPGQFYDLDSVQVFEGPQGTLFGKASTGGVLMVRPKKPTNDFEGYAQVLVGNYNWHQLEFAVNLPIWDDKLSIRVSGLLNYRDGFTKNLAGPAFSPGLGQKDVANWLDNQDSQGFRVSVMMRPTDDFENYIVANSYYLNDDGTGFQFFDFQPTTGVVAQSFLAVKPAIIGQSLVAEAIKYSTIASGNGPLSTLVGPSHDSQFNYSIQDVARWDINEDLTVKNIASASVIKSNSVPVSGGDTEIPPVLSAYAIPNQPYAGHWWQEGVAYTEEPQIQARLLNDRMNLTIGGYLSFSHPLSEPVIGTYGPSPAIVVPAFGLNIPPSFTLSTLAKTSASAREQAIYGQESYDLGGILPFLDGVKFTAGYRYTWDYSSTVTTNLAPTASITNASSRTSAPTFTIGLDYQLDPDTLLYVASRRGYSAAGAASTIRPGIVLANGVSFPNGTSIFAPAEKVTDVEVGVKNNFELFGVNGQVAADYYHDWFPTRHEAQLLPTLGFVNTTVVTVASNSLVDGFEVSYTVKPLDGLTISGNYDYLLSRHQPYGVFGIINPAGLTTNVPRHKMSITAKYRLPLDASIGTVDLSATGSFVDQQKNVDYVEPVSNIPGLWPA